MPASLPTHRAVAAATFLALALAATTHAVLAQAPSTTPPPLPLTSELRWPGTTSYDAAIPTPEEVIGHRVGSRHTDPAQVVRYFEAVAAASDRVTVRQHGRTHEGRPLVHAVVTTPARQSRLDELQAQHRRLFDDPAGFRDSELDDTPAVAYMGYSIHGDEASGTEAALLTLYHLAAGRGPGVDSVLERVVTLIDPMFNPDGRDRFVDWANRHRGAVASSDPQGREQNQAWPRGRTNHYWFDLNRDWLPLQHPESQARIALFRAWRPQVLTDYHEMGSEATYFFQPGIPSRTNPYTPARNQELTGLITDYTARGLDRIGSLYYTRESFDDFYYGKGSTYPDVNGAVGILFEQASSRALEREVDGGRDVLTYGFTVRNQTVGSLATLQAVAALKDELLRHTRDFYAGSSAYAKTVPFAAYVLPLDAGQRTRALELGRLLRRHGVEVYANVDAVSAQGKTYPAGAALVVPTDQRQSRFVQAVMEPNTTFRDSLFYDVSTWALPLAYDVTVHRVQRQPAQPQGELPELPATAGRVVGDGAASYAYVIPWQGYGAPGAAYDLLRAGVRVRQVHDPIRVGSGGREVPLSYGALVVPVAQNAVPADSVRAAVRRAARERGVTAYAVTTGLTPAGPDLGGRSTGWLREPKVALVVGDGTNAYQAGAVWHLLSKRMRMPVTLLDAERVGRVDLNRYTHLALAGGRYGGLDAEALKAWVRGGGTLLASHTAAPWAVDQELAKLEEVELDVDSLLLARGLPYAQLDEARGAQYIGGAILRVALDTTHPLAYGLGAEVPMFRQHTRFFRPSERPGANVGVYVAPDALASGYLSGERRRQIPGQAAVVDAPLGRGRVLLFFDEPAFRAFWRGSERVWLNGLFLR